MSNAKVSALLTRETGESHPGATERMVDVITSVKKLADYLDAEGIIDAEKMRLTFAKRQDRQDAVKELSKRGMSHRKIAGVVGASKAQVTRDLGPNGPKPGPGGPPKDDPQASAETRKREYAEAELPPGRDPEGEASIQETLYDQGCLILEEMSDVTRRRFVAFVMETYGD